MNQQLQKLLFEAFETRLAESRGRRSSLVAFCQPYWLCSSSSSVRWEKCGAGVGGKRFSLLDFLPFTQKLVLLLLGIQMDSLTASVGWLAFSRGSPLVFSRIYFFSPFVALFPLLSAADQCIGTSARWSYEDTTRG